MTAPHSMVRSTPRPTGRAGGRPAVLALALALVAVVLSACTPTQVWSWGFNGSGQLGDGTTTQRNAPVAADAGWKQVSAAAWHTLAVRADGTLWAWGDNSNGELGDGTTTNRLSPVQIGTATSWAPVEAGSVSSSDGAFAS